MPDSRSITCTSTCWEAARLDGHRADLDMRRSAGIITRSFSCRRTASQSRCGLHNTGTGVLLCPLTRGSGGRDGRGEIQYGPGPSSAERIARQRAAPLQEADPADRHPQGSPRARALREAQRQETESARRPQAQDETGRKSRALSRGRGDTLCPVRRRRRRRHPPFGAEHSGLAAPTEPWRRFLVALAAGTILSTLLTIQLLPDKVSLRVGQTAPEDIVAHKYAQYRGYRRNPPSPRRRRAERPQTVRERPQRSPASPRKKSFVSSRPFAALRTPAPQPARRRGAEERQRPCLPARVSSRRRCGLIPSPSPGLEPEAIRLVRQAMGRVISDDTDDLARARRALAAALSGRPRQRSRRMGGAPILVGVLPLVLRPNRIFDAANHPGREPPGSRRRPADLPDDLPRRCHHPAGRAGQRGAYRPFPGAGPPAAAHRLPDCGQPLASSASAWWALPGFICRTSTAGCTTRSRRWCCSPSPSARPCCWCGSPG